MASFTNWIKQAVTSIVDPEKEVRLSNLIQVIHRDLYQKKQQFVLAESVRGLDFKPQDLEFAKEHIYRELLQRAWLDGALTEGEQQAANWAARSLQMAQSRVREINAQFARDRFSVVLAQAMDDGYLDPNEELKLKQIAATAGLSLSDFARTFFHSACEGFLRGIFAACVAENQISQKGWSQLVTTASKLGVSGNELLQAIQPQARQFVEHVLTDAKADGRLSEHEDSVLKWLISNLGLPPDHCAYVNAEMATLRALTLVTEGKLPSLSRPANVAIRSGEIVHFHGPATLRRIKVLKNSPRTEDFSGELTMTDNRLVFTGATTSLNVTYRSVISFRGGDNSIAVQTQGKPFTTFLLPHKSALPYAIFHSALSLANQTLVSKVEDAPSRHIPRDVRQRVWQRYGGRCAECNADDYLEFDHIIPVTKGGNNFDANVQLLCRRCNLKKSDFI